ncbi:TD and POZ domain-containing protein 1-like [Argiope bruennichi]|uniref:TD and POZ domain-containing protein 1-like n=1 Tax=Argiope bruennichi TaxID=94029 RepID=UPI002493F1DA|nr:TD and POZ domain-containing protein 1-like [Argiope bruennichi]
MATEINDETIGCTFQWKIENISHCWLKKNEFIESPVFTADALKGTKWKLYFYPMGCNNENKLDFSLHRVPDNTGKNFVQLNYLLAFVDKSGSILHEINGLPNLNFGMNSMRGFLESQTRDFIFGSGKEAYLPEDTLTVQCTLWEKEKKPDKVEHLYARTVYIVNRRSFLWRMEKFSSLKSGKKYKLTTDFIDLDFFITEGLDFEKKLGLKFNHRFSLKYFSFITSVVDLAGRKKNCGTHEYFQEDLRKGVSCMLLSTKELMENQSHYLPNDMLTLECECVYSTGAATKEFCGFLMESPESTNEIVESISERNIQKGESQNLSNLAEDLKSIYNDTIFSDIEVRTSTKTFPTHKNILTARSPVFRTMFSNDMKERNSGHVDITDFEDDTVHRMLLYMYTDSLEDLQFESASSLYKIADKYQILSLKRRCSFFLKMNLSASNACDILILADLLDDGDLKRAAQDYILGQKKDFFCSQEWKELMKTHLDIAADVMVRKMYQE